MGFDIYQSETEGTPLGRIKRRSVQLQSYDQSYEYTKTLNEVVWPSLEISRDALDIKF